MCKKHWKTIAQIIHGLPSTSHGHHGSSWHPLGLSLVIPEASQCLRIYENVSSNGHMCPKQLKILSSNHSFGCPTPPMGNPKDLLGLSKRPARALPNHPRGFSKLPRASDEPTATKHQSPVSSHKPAVTNQQCSRM